jgi:hypothetical protein
MQAAQMLLKRIVRSEKMTDIRIRLITAVTAMAVATQYFQAFPV